MPKHTLLSKDIVCLFNLKSKRSSLRRNISFKLFKVMPYCNQALQFIVRIILKSRIFFIAIIASSQLIEIY